MSNWVAGCRVNADFTWFGGRSAAIKIDGVRNFEITDNDLYSAWISIGNG